MVRLKKLLADLFQRKGGGSKSPLDLQLQVSPVGGHIFQIFRPPGKPGALQWLCDLLVDVDHVVQIFPGQIRFPLIRDMAVLFISNGNGFTDDVLIGLLILKVCNPKGLIIILAIVFHPGRKLALISVTQKLTKGLDVQGPVGVWRTLVWIAFRRVHNGAHPIFHLRRK